MSEHVTLPLDHDTEQYPLRALEHQLGGIFQAEATAKNWAEIIQSARNSISAREWGA
jgi:hypothetical protein